MLEDRIWMERLRQGIGYVLELVPVRIKRLRRGGWRWNRLSGVSRASPWAQEGSIRVVYRTQWHGKHFRAIGP